MTSIRFEHGETRISSLRGQALVDAYDRATAVKLLLTDEFRRTSLPVQSLSNVFAHDEDRPGVAVNLTRDPTPEEIPQLPNDRDGVPVRYYTVRDGSIMKYARWDGPGG